MTPEEFYNEEHKKKGGENEDSPKKDINDLTKEEFELFLKEKIAEEMGIDSENIEIFHLDEEEFDERLEQMSVEEEMDVYQNPEVVEKLTELVIENLSKGDAEITKYLDEIIDSIEKKEDKILTLSSLIDFTEKIDSNAQSIILRKLGALTSIQE